MMINQVAVIIPFYKDFLSDYEKIALRQCEKILSSFPKIAIKPNQFTLPHEAKVVSFSNVVSFSDHFFKGLAGYNELMLSPLFYEQFLDYEYILIYQMDCFVFKNELQYWCDQHFDYIGAPWIRKTYHKNIFEMMLVKIQQFMSDRFNRQDNDIPNKYQFENKVGNGGFSLRKVRKFYDLCIIMKPVIDFYLSQTIHQYNEDVFWSIEVNRQNNVLNIPTLQTGLKFAFEVPPVKSNLLHAQNLPFGCHDWDKYAEFWRPIFKNFEYEI